MEKSIDELLEKRKKLQSILDERNNLDKVRNVKVFSKTIRRLTPYIISTAIASTGLYYLGFGKPFIRDEISVRKVYELEYQTPEIKKVGEKYDTKLISDYFSRSEFILYTPFTLTDDEMYTRHKITYKVKNIYALDIYDALMNDNYEYILENVVPVSDETEKVNMLSSYYVNDYYADVKLEAIDSNNVIKHKESVKTNIFITGFDMLTAFWMGLIFNKHKKKTFNDEIVDIYDEYNASLRNFYDKYNITSYGLEDEIASLDKQIKGAKKL